MQSKTSWKEGFSSPKLFRLFFLGGGIKNSHLALSWKHPFIVPVNTVVYGNLEAKKDTNSSPIQDCFISYSTVLTQPLGQLPSVTNVL